MSKKQIFASGSKKLSHDFWTIYSYRIELKLHEWVPLINVSSISIFFSFFYIFPPPSHPGGGLCPPFGERFWTNQPILMKQTPFYSRGKYKSDAVVQFQNSDFQKSYYVSKMGLWKMDFFQVQHTLIWYQIGSTLHADSKKAKKFKIATTEL